MPFVISDHCDYFHILNNTMAMSAKVANRPPPFNAEMIQRIEAAIDAEHAVASAAAAINAQTLAGLPWVKLTTKHSDMVDEIRGIIWAARDEAAARDKTVAHENTSPGMAEIATLLDGNVLLSGALGIHGIEGEYKSRISGVSSEDDIYGHLLDVIDTENGTPTRVLPAEDRPTYDMTPHFRDVGEFAVSMAMDNKLPIAIHCHAGINRGPILATVCMMALTGASLRETIREITLQRPRAFQNTAFVTQLVLWADENGMY